MTTSLLTMASLTISLCQMRARSRGCEVDAMKKILSALLATFMVLTVCTVPASAVSSGVLQTCYHIIDMRYGKRNGLKYDIDLRSILGKGHEGGRSPDAITLSKDTGEVEYGVTVSINSYADDAAYAQGVAYPIIKCWFDDVLVSDGKKVQKAYQEMESHWGYPLLVDGLVHTSTMIDGYASGGDYGPDWTVIPTEKFSFNTTSLSPGKHTIRFSVNPDFMDEEEDPSNNTAVREIYIKESSDTPAAPALAAVTSSSIAVTAVSGQEYSIDGGTTWQSRGLFEGLEPETSYEVITRTAETDTAMASAVSAPLTVTTKPLAPDAPAAPVLESVTSSSITVSAVAGLEYNLNGGAWQDSATFSGLSPNTRYEIRARVKATGDMPCSEASPALAVTTDKQSVSAPAAPVLASRTDTSVTVQTAPGQEYSIDGGSTWQSSGTFTGLSPNREYSIAARIAETETAYASPSSPALSVKTKKPAPSAPAAPRLWSRTDTTITIY